MSDSSPAVFAATDRVAASSTSVMVLIGRVLLGWLFFISGWAKLTGIAGTIGYLTNLGVPMPGLMAWVAAVVEFVVGAALILGIATRYASLVMIIFVLVATFLAHRYWEYPAAQMQGQFNNFLKNIAIIGGGLLLFVTGAGKISIDGMMRK